MQFYIPPTDGAETLDSRKIQTHNLFLDKIKINKKSVYLCGEH